MRTKIPAVALAATLFCGVLATAPVTTAEAAARPFKINNIKATPGPGIGEITFRWSQNGRNTARYELETGLTTFSKTSSRLPKHGRHAKVFRISRTRRSLTLSAAQVRAAGASVASANSLYFRFSAVNGSLVRSYPYLQAVLPKPAPTRVRGTAARIATFNIRSAKITSDSRRWLVRAPDVAREIRDAKPGIVALQELSPGRADGRARSTTGSVRQTTSLEKALRRVGAGQYRLVRETPYVKPGKTHGSQGTRILYDTRRFSLASRCSEKTGRRNYSSSCTLNLPLLSGDGENRRRSAAYALLRNRRTGQKIWVASVHLDERHSGRVRKERVYDALRGRQIHAVYARVARLNTGHHEIVVAGDINSWQNNKGGNTPHDLLVRAGFLDTAGAATRINTQYSTINHFRRSLSPSAQGMGSRIDVVMVRGAKVATRFENVTRKVDSTRPSDHNLVVGDVVL